MLIRGERAGEPERHDSDHNHENARPGRVLHCGKDCTPIKVQEVQAYKGYQGDVRVMRIAPVMEGEGDHRGKRPPEPGDSRDHEEKEAGMPRYLARQSLLDHGLLGHGSQACRSRIHQQAPLPEMTAAGVPKRRFTISLQRFRDASAASSILTTRKPACPSLRGLFPSATQSKK